MKILFEIISAFLYFNSVAPAFMYYIYEENPNTGYVAAVSGTGPYERSKSQINIHKKHFIGSNNQKYTKLVNERAVDSHFTALKTPPKPLLAVDNQNFIDHTKIHRNAVNSQHNINAREDRNSKYEDNNVNASTKGNVKDIYEDKLKTTTSDNEAYTPNNVQNYNKREFYEHSNTLLEKKGNFVAINEHRAQVSKEQRAVNIKNNNQQSMRQSQKYHAKVAGSGVKDKILHKATTTNERNTQIWKNNDMSQKTPNSNMQKIESKKRDTLNREAMSSLHGYTASNSISDKVRKYINKEISYYNEYKKNIVPARIGNHEEIVDVNKTPYALFYRMNPENLDEQEVFIGNPLAEPSSDAYSGRKRWNYELQYDSAKNKSKRAPKVKIHKKVKNHTSYGNR